MNFIFEVLTSVIMKIMKIFRSVTSCSFANSLRRAQLPYKLHWVTNHKSYFCFFFHFSLPISFLCLFYNSDLGHETTNLESSLCCTWNGGSPQAGPLFTLEKNKRYKQKADAWSKSVMLDLRVRNFEFSVPLILRQNCECRKKIHIHKHLIRQETPPPPKKAITVQAWTGLQGYRRLRLPDF